MMYLQSCKRVPLAKLVIRSHGDRHAKTTVAYSLSAYGVSPVGGSPLRPPQSEFSGLVNTLKGLPRHAPTSTSAGARIQSVSWTETCWGRSTRITFHPR
jgi:hypothetical protein